MHRTALAVAKQVEDKDELGDCAEPARHRADTVVCG